MPGAGQEPVGWESVPWVGSHAWVKRGNASPKSRAFSPFAEWAWQSTLLELQWLSPS